MLRTALTIGFGITAVAALGVAGWYALTRLEARLMANFDALNSKIDDLGTALDELESEWATFKDTTGDDSTDQAAVDAATARMDAAISRVRAVDLIADVPPSDGESTLA